MSGKDSCRYVKGSVAGTSAALILFLEGDGHHREASERGRLWRGSAGGVGRGQAVDRQWQHADADDRLQRLGAMMLEYATTVKSSDVGLPWEVHFKAKKQFELTDLKAIFEFCVQALRELGPQISSPPLEPQLNNLVLRLTTLVESVLSWTFINVNLPKKLISVFESDQNPSLRPGAPWKDTILQPSITELFFEVRKKVAHQFKTGYDGPSFSASHESSS